MHFHLHHAQNRALIFVIKLLQINILRNRIRNNGTPWLLCSDAIDNCLFFDHINNPPIHSF